MVTGQRPALAILELTNPSCPVLTPPAGWGARSRVGRGATKPPNPKAPNPPSPALPGTYGDAVSEAGARLRAGRAYVVPHAGVLAGRAVQIRHGPRAVGPGEASGPRWVGACRGSGCAKIRLSTVAIQDWCAENKAGYEARRRACTGFTKPNTRINSLGPILTLNQGHARGEQVLEKSQPGLLRSLELQKYIYGYI